MPGGAPLRFVTVDCSEVHISPTDPSGRGSAAIQLAIDGSAMSILVDAFSSPPMGEEHKVKLLLVFTSANGGEEEKLKVPCYWSAAEPAPTTAQTVTAPHPTSAQPTAAPPSSTTSASQQEPTSPPPTSLDSNSGAGAEAMSHPHSRVEASTVVDTAPQSTGPTFEVSVSVGSIESPLLRSGQRYALHVCRGDATQTLPPVPCTMDGCLAFSPESGTAVISNCFAVYKPDGTPARRLLELALVDTDTGAKIGFTRFDTADCDEGERSADVNFKGDPDSKFIDVCMGMFYVENTEEAERGGAPASAAAASSSSQQTPGASPSPSHYVPSDAVLGRVQERLSARPPSMLILGQGERDDQRTYPASPLPPVASPVATVAGTNITSNNPLGDFTSTEAKPLSAMETNVGVYVRVRPVLPAMESPEVAWSIDDDQCTVRDGEGHKYMVDQIFPPTFKNNDVYSEVGSKLISGLISGLNGTLFMYGQTASGKTHTVFGTSGESGLCAMVINNLFDSLEAERAQNMANGIQDSAQITASFFEIYNEELNDLLDTNRRNVSVRAGKGGSFVADVSAVKVNSAEGCFKALAQGNENKHVGQSVLNDRSSRSHSIFQLKVKRVVVEGGQRKSLSAELNLVDLAGSETLMLGATGTDVKAQKKETAHINLSLTYLKKVIKELADKSPFVSYRNSALTKVLKQSLGGNSRTVLICCVTAAHQHRKDTRNTLIFATTAKTVTTTVRVNATITSDRGLKEEVRRLRKELEVAQDALRYYEGVEDDLRTLNEYSESLRAQLEEQYEVNQQMKEAVSAAESKTAQQPVGAVQQQQPEEREEAPSGTTKPGSGPIRPMQQPKREMHSPDGGPDAADELLGDEAKEEGKEEEETRAVPQPAVVEAAKEEEVAASGEQEQVEQHVDPTGTILPPPPHAPTGAPGKKGMGGTSLHEIQRLRQQVIQLKASHRGELLAKEELLRDAVAMQAKASDEVAGIMEKEERVARLLQEIHRFLFYGTPVTVVSYDEKKKQHKDEKLWLSYLHNAKGEISVALYALTEQSKTSSLTTGVTEAGGEPGSTTPPPPPRGPEPDRNKLIVKLHVSDCKKVLLGQSEETPFATATIGESAATSGGATPMEWKKGSRCSFSMIFRKKQTLNIVCRDASDFEAWVIDLNKLLRSSAQWAKPLDLSGHSLTEKLTSEEKTFCADLNISPEDYLHAKERIAERRDRFITLFDVRSLTRFDLYHSQRLFYFMRCAGYISQASLFYLTDKFADSFGEEWGQEEEEDPSSATPGSTTTGSAAGTTAA